MSDLDLSCCTSLHELTPGNFVATIATNNILKLNLATLSITRLKQNDFNRYWHKKGLIMFDEKNSFDLAKYITQINKMEM